MGYWESLKSEAKLKSMMRSKINADAMLQQDMNKMSRIEAMYNVDVSLQNAIDARLNEIEENERQGITFKRASKLKTKYKNISESMKRDRELTYGKVLPGVQQEVKAAKDSIKADDPIQNYDQIFKKTGENKVNLNNLFQLGQQAPAGFDELQANALLCTHLLSQALSGNMSEDWHKDFEKLLDQTAELGILPAYFLAPIQEGSNKRGVDLLLEKRHAGIVFGILRGELLGRIYNLVKDLDPSVLKADEFGKMLKEMQTNRMAAYRLGTGAAFRGLVQEYAAEEIKIEEANKKQAEAPEVKEDEKEQAKAPEVKEDEKEQAKAPEVKEDEKEQAKVPEAKEAKKEQAKENNKEKAKAPEKVEKKVPQKSDQRRKEIFDLLDKYSTENYKEGVIDTDIALYCCTTLKELEDATSVNNRSEYKKIINKSLGILGEFDPSFYTMLSTESKLDYMLNYHPYVTIEIIKYMQLLIFYNLHSSADKKVNEKSQLLSAKDLENIADELAYNKEVLDKYEGMHWFRLKLNKKEASDKVFNKDDIPQISLNEDQINKADQYAKKQFRDEMVAIRDQYKGDKKRLRDDGQSYNRLMAFFGVKQTDMLQGADYQKMDSLKNEKYTFSPEAMKKIIIIRDLDKLLGIKRTEAEYLVKVEENAGTEADAHIILDVIATAPKIIWNEAIMKQSLTNVPYMDGEFVRKLMDFDLNGTNLAKLLNEVMAGEEIVQLKRRMKDTKEALEKKLPELLMQESYEDESLLEEIITHFKLDSDLMKDKLYIKRKVGQTLTKKYYEEEKQQPALYYSDYLYDWLNNVKKIDKQSEYMVKTVEAINDYVDFAKTKWGCSQYYDKLNNMLDTFRSWMDKVKDKDKKTDQDAKACDELFAIFGKLYGKVIFEESKKNKGLEEIRKQCDLQDKITLSWAEYIYAQQLEEYRQKGKEDRFKKLNEYPKLVDRSKEPLFAHEPCAEDIRQGNLGDCYFLASLMALVKTGSGNITSIMDDLGDIVRVKFVSRTVYVSKKICIPYCAGTTLWVAIMEKAFAMAQNNTEESIDKIGNEGDIKFIDKLLKDTGFGDLSAEQKDKKIVETYSKTVHQIGQGGLAYNTFDTLFLRNWEKAIETDDIKQLYLISGLSYHWGAFEDADEKLWDRVISYDFSNFDKKMNGQWKSIKTFLKEQISKKLVAEMEYRQTAPDTKYGRQGYRALTIDDYKDTLKNIKNWKKQNGRSTYCDLLVAMEDKFSDIKFDEATLLECLTALGDEFMEAGKSIETRIPMQYRCKLEKDAKVYYTDSAIKMYEKIEKHFSYSKGKIMLASTAMFLEANKDCTIHSADVIGGVVTCHEYILTGCKEVDGHKYIKLWNTWGEGELLYTERTRLDKSKYTIGQMHRINSEETVQGSEFEIELNDFMNKFANVSYVEK